MTTNGTLGAMNGKFPPEKRASDQIKRVAAVDIGVVERLLRRKNAARELRHQKRLPVSAERDAHALLDQLQKAAAQKLRWQRPQRLFRVDLLRLTEEPRRNGHALIEICQKDEFVLRKAVAGHHAKASFSLAFPARER